MPPSTPRPLVFDDVVIDFGGRRLLRGGVDQALEPKAFAVLALLAAAPGQTFSRDDILDAVWGHRHVTQSVLNRVMSLLRQALGEDAQHPRRLRTVHGVGYRFELPETTAAAPPASPARRQILRWAWLAAAAALAAVLLAAWLRREDTRPAISASAAPSLAVLPFADLSRARDQEYLADGLAEEILDQLAQSPALRVVGRTSSFSFKGTRADLRQIARQLGVAYLLEGSVRREGDDLRVTAQLVRADDGTHLWSKTYARQVHDVFAMQEEIARDVARALSVKLDVAQYNREQGGTTRIEAYERFLRWRGILMRGSLDLAHDRQRLQLAREMVALDPRCVLCQDALASSLASVAQEVGGAQAASLRSEEAQVRARIAAIAPDSWIARRDQANALWREGHRAEAIALARRGVEAAPPSKERAWDYAFMLYGMGHIEDAVALVEQVRASEPMALYLSRDLQFDYTAARRYDDAEAEYQRGRTLAGSQLSPDYLAFLRQLAGKRAGGLPALRELHARLLGRDREFDTPFFHDLGSRLDDRQAMRALLRRALADEAYGGGTGLAHVLTNVADALGDADLAVIALRRELAAWPGFKEGAMAQYPYVAFWNSPYSGLRAHPGFKQLLVETGVVDYWRRTGRWGDGCAPVGAEDFRCR